jgi:ABC-type lipoprotein export system ATPase subunit
VATAIDRSAPDAGKPGGRRRRSRRRAAAVAETQMVVSPAAVEAPVEAPVQAAAEAPAAPEPTSALLPAVTAEGVLPKAERRRTPRRAVRPVPEPEPPPPEPVAFLDLLSQAVGLRLDEVSREFDTGEMKVLALRYVSLEIAPGEFVSVVGPSGCGKTTLLSMMGGLDRPTTGRVYAAGLPLDQLSETDLADYRLQRVSTIFQTFNLVPAMNVEENVVLPLALAGVEPAERRIRAERLLELVGLEGKARVRASRLSGGEQQKVAVARALANRPGLILADEPTGSLDSAAGEKILDLLKDLNRRGATVVLVTHDPEVARHANRAVRMIDGRAIELNAGGRNIRNQDPVEPPKRLHWRDTLRMGLLSAGRRPLRTSLTTTGVAIGIAAMSLIVALSGGLGYALSAPALAQSQVDMVSVRPAPNAANPTFDAATLTVLREVPHVQAAWGDVALTGSFTSASTPAGAPVAELISLPPRAQSSSTDLVAGRMPSSDSALEILLSSREVEALGFGSPRRAVGSTVTFTAVYGSPALAGTAAAAAAKPIPLQLIVVGVVPDQAMPAGIDGGLAPNRLVADNWTKLAKANSWKNGEFTAITVLADSGATVGGVRDSVQRLGFQAQTTGDQLRSFAELLGRLRVALLGLSVVALLLACLGIANTMYSSVLERTKEIGVLKAVGARSRDVLLLFVAEAAVIGLAGGLLGAAFAALLARAGNTAVDRLVPALAGASVDVFRPDFAVALAALVVAVLLSTGSGLLPALRAARQDPVKALHYE